MAQGFDKQQTHEIVVTFRITRKRDGNKRAWTDITDHPFTIAFNPERGMWRVTGQFGGKAISAHGDTVDAATLTALRMLIAMAN